MVVINILVNILTVMASGLASGVWPGRIEDRPCLHHSTTCEFIDFRHVAILQIERPTAF